MDRLTRRIGLNRVESDCLLASESEWNDFVNDCLKKLADYEDLIEQGKMIELPCRVGDTVYSVEYDYYKDGLKVKDVKIKSLIHLMNIGLEEFNEWVFLTREQAEEKLGEMER